MRFQQRPLIADYLNGSRWLVDFKNTTDDLVGIEKIQMAFYTGEDNLLDNLEEYQPGSSEIITKNNWHNSKV